MSNPLVSRASLAVCALMATLAGACHPTKESPNVPSIAAQTKYPKPSPNEIRAKLTPLQYEVTQHEATEPPFRNAYWNNHEDGLYVDVVTGEPLFSSRDKFESGTGWPSFTRPVDAASVTEHTDATLGMVRTEVRSASGDSHLGHVFEDGPAPSHMRYCINSASLRFIPASRLEAEGYGAYRNVVQGHAAPIVDTDNACAVPPPGEVAGCSTTLETAILSADARAADVLAKTPGVLQVESGAVAGVPAARVTFDPKKLAFAALLDAWAAAPADRRAILAVNADQKREADAWKLHASSARGLTVEESDERRFAPGR